MLAIIIFSYNSSLLKYWTSGLPDSGNTDIKSKQQATPRAPSLSGFHQWEREGDAALIIGGDKAYLVPLNHIIGWDMSPSSPMVATPMVAREPWPDPGNHEQGTMTRNHDQGTMTRASWPGDHGQGTVTRELWPRDRDQGTMTRGPWSKSQNTFLGHIKCSFPKIDFLVPLCPHVQKIFIGIHSRIFRFQIMQKSL